MTQAIPFDKPAADLLLSKAKIAVMKDKKLVFFSVLMMNMRYRWDTTLPTAATNGKTIFTNPAFFNGMTPAERVFVLVHEVLHCALYHLLRIGSRDARKWNRACDYFINLMLTDAGFTKPAIALWNDAYRGMSAEQIYDVLPEQEEPDFEPDLNGPPDPDDTSTPEKTKYEMDKLVVQASTQAQQAGQAAHIPGAIAFYLQKLLNPTLRWDIILRRWFGQYIKSGFTWKTPNRRFDHEYLPSRGKPSINDVAMATDISGSVSDADYQSIVSNVGGVFQRLKPKWMHYLQFSDSLVSVNKVRSLKELQKIEFKGRGGTDITAVIEWANQNQPRVLVFLTDGEFYWPDITPTCDVVWLIHDNPDFTAPYGKVIHYQMNHG